MGILQYGDPGYVKTVAGIMRLPGSTNTKPERDNAVVEIVASCPERRYPLPDFEWLAAPPAQKSEKINGLTVVTLNGNGQHRLSRRTESYLSTGAADGNRNAELFAAACQMRDAGYSQGDAERDLIPRHVADGIGSESATVREREKPGRRLPAPTAARRANRSSRPGRRSRICWINMTARNARPPPRSPR